MIPQKIGSTYWIEYVPSNVPAWTDYLKYIGPAKYIGLRNEAYTFPTDEIYEFVINGSKRFFFSEKHIIRETLPAPDPTFIVPAGTYILGDPCYSFPDDKDNDDWIYWLDQCHPGIYGTPSKVGNTPNGFTVRAHDTLYGDGCYPLLKGGKVIKYLPVDAGLIGFVPIDYCSKIIEDLVTVVTLEKDTICTRLSNGNIEFGDYVVVTGDENVEEYDEL